MKMSSMSEASGDGFPQFPPSSQARIPKIRLLIKKNKYKAKNINLALENFGIFLKLTSVSFTKQIKSVTFIK